MNTGVSVWIQSSIVLGAKPEIAPIAKSSSTSTGKGTKGNRARTEPAQGKKDTKKGQLVTHGTSWHFTITWSVHVPLLFRFDCAMPRLEIGASVVAIDASLTTSGSAVHGLPCFLDHLFN